MEKVGSLVETRWKRGRRFYDSLGFLLFFLHTLDGWGIRSMTDGED